MPLWNKTDAAASAPKFQLLAGANTLANAAFGNTTSGAYLSGIATGVFGADSTEARVAGFKGQHQGWQKVTFGTGPVTSLTVSAGGTLYTNGDIAKVSGGTVNATATVVTNGSGVITSLTGLSGGAGFKTVATSTVSIANSTGGATTGSGATLTPVLGGRAGRVQYETLVATRITSDAADDTILPDA